MKKAIFITCAVIIGTVILIHSGILDALVFLLLFGVVPGTSFSIPSGIMLLGIIGIIWVVLFRFTAIEALYVVAKNRTKRKNTERKKRMPKRRFNQV